MLRLPKNCKLIISAVAPRGDDDDLEHKRLYFNMLLLNYCRKENLTFYEHNNLSNRGEIKQTILYST